MAVGFYTLLGKSVEMWLEGSSCLGEGACDVKVGFQESLGELWVVLSIVCVR